MWNFSYDDNVVNNTNKFVDKFYSNTQFLVTPLLPCVVWLIVVNCEQISIHLKYAW